jgi:hypothetical protein
VIGRGLTASHDADLGSSCARLADCDETLSTITADIAGLLEEIAFLRAAAGRLVERQSEQEAVLARQQLELTQLEAERSLGRSRTDELEAAETRLRESDGRAASLAHELQRLRDAVAARDRHVAELEGELTRTRKTLSAREAARGSERPRLDELGLEPGREGGARPAHAAASPPSDVRPEEASTGHVRFVAYPDGYRLLSSDERCARSGDVVEVEGRSFLVSRIGRSPLPGDRRPCAFLTTDASAA